MVTGILWAYLETGNSMIMSYFNLKPSHTILLCAILCTNGKASPSLLGHCDERPRVQSNLSYQATLMRYHMYSQTCLMPLWWDTTCTVKPVLSSHCHERPHAQSNLSYQATVMRGHMYSQTCLIRPLSWEATCTVKPVLSGHCHEMPTCTVKPAIPDSDEWPT